MSEFITCSRGHRYPTSTGNTFPQAGGGACCPICAAEACEPTPILQPSVNPSSPETDGPRLSEMLEEMRRRSKPDRATPRVPGYEILEEVGRGGMGVVYKARQVGLNRLVALKMILAGTWSGPEERQRFQREAEAVARLRHPQIVQIHEVGEHEGIPYFSLEFAEGGSLSKQLAGAPLPPRQAAELVEGLARAMHAAHQQGIVHRDLKPANILLACGGSQPPDSSEAENKPGRLYPPLADAIAKITDFGLAKNLDQSTDQTRSGAILGTPSYMAPEQAAGRSKEVGPATDIYALGAILYELLTGRPPFRGTTTLETLEQVRTQEPVAPGRLQPRLPRDLETICLKCLAKEPRLRYGSAVALADDLCRFREGKPIQARPVPAWERLVKWTRRQPATAALIAVLGVMGLLAALGMAWHNRRLQEQVRRADDRYRAA